VLPPELLDVPPLPPSVDVDVVLVVAVVIETPPVVVTGSAVDPELPAVVVVDAGSVDPLSAVGSPAPTQVFASSGLARSPNLRPEGQSASGKLQ
jgi:hypothetical protein